MPTIPRLFLNCDLGAGFDITLGAGQTHYLTTVMRRSVTDEVHVFNGRDGEWRTRIAELRRDRGALSVETLVRPQEPEDDLWLAFALLKRDATDLVVQKATELGASVICPIITERTNAGRVNEARLLSIAIEAAEQSDRLTVPHVPSPSRLANLIAGWPPDRPLFVAVERSNGPRPRPVTGACGLLVGPEGGFSSVELDAMRRYPFVAFVSLGPRVLRAETACVAGLALLRAPGCS